MSRSYQIHRFFCIKCGNEGIPLSRRQGHKHEKFHRKKLYCTHCKQEINHIECKNDEEVYDFRLDFGEGAFINEAKESVAISGMPRQR